MKTDIKSYFKVSAVNILALLLIIDAFLIILQRSATLYHTDSLTFEKWKLVYDFITGLIAFVSAFFLLYRYNWARITITVLMILSISEGLNDAIETYQKMPLYLPEDAKDFLLPDLTRQIVVCIVALWFLLRLNSSKIISEFQERVSVNFKVPSAKTFAKGALFILILCLLISNIKYLISNDYYFIYPQDAGYNQVEVPIFGDKSESSNVITNIQTYVPFFLISIENDLMGREWYRVAAKSGQSGFLLNKRREIIISQYTYKDIVACSIIRISNLVSR